MTPLPRLSIGWRRALCALASAGASPQRSAAALRSSEHSTTLRKTDRIATSGFRCVLDAGKTPSPRQ